MKPDVVSDLFSPIVLHFYITVTKMTGQKQDKCLFRGAEWGTVMIQID